MKRTPLKRKTPMRQRSKKKNSELAQRRTLKADLLATRGPSCQAQTEVCTGAAHDMHERVLRSQGGSALDADNILLVCRPCHNWIHANPGHSYELGLLRHDWQAER